MVSQQDHQTSEQSFVNAFINIWIAEINNRFIWKPRSNDRDGGWETAKKRQKGSSKLFDMVKVRDGGVRETERIYKGS